MVRMRKSVEGVAPINHSSFQKTRLNDLSYGIKIWTDLSSVLSQCTRLTDRRTDRILIARPRMQRGKKCKANELACSYLSYGQIKSVVFAGVCF